ncbi:hypothetical protein, partial [Pseudomonas versuta]|uniref:hypothetical protein n=1 Tax=Pseudomonas versuta TaxID=1788301 RepID=UPI0037CB76AA
NQICVLGKLITVTPQEVFQEKRVFNQILSKGRCAAYSLQLLSFVIKRIKVSDFVRIYACLTQLMGVEVRVLP